MFLKQVVVDCKNVFRNYNGLTVEYGRLDTTGASFESCVG